MKKNLIKVGVEFSRYKTRKGKTLYGLFFVSQDPEYRNELEIFDMDRESYVKIVGRLAKAFNEEYAKLDKGER